jgi:hypothetical protein
MNNMEEYSSEENIMPSDIVMAPVSSPSKMWGISCKGVHIYGYTVQWWVVLVIALIVAYMYNPTSTPQFISPQFESMNFSGGAPTSYSPNIHPELRQIMGMGTW